MIVTLFHLGIAKILESIGHEKYLGCFIEHEIDFPTFLSLEDADLKELGIKALGSRKKILVVIKQCKEGTFITPKETVPGAIGQPRKQTELKSDPSPYSRSIERGGQIPVSSDTTH